MRASQDRVRGLGSCSVHKRKYCGKPVWILEHNNFLLLSVLLLLLLVAVAVVLPAFLSLLLVVGVGVGAWLAWLWGLGGSRTMWESTKSASLRA